LIIFNAEIRPTQFSAFHDRIRELRELESSAAPGL